MSHTAGASNRKAGRQGRQAGRRRRQSISFLHVHCTYVSSFPFELAKSARQARGGSKARGDQPASQSRLISSIHPSRRAQRWVHSLNSVYSIRCYCSSSDRYFDGGLRCGIINFLTRRTGPFTQPPPKTRIEFKSKLQINKSWSRSPARSARPAIPPRM